MIERSETTVERHIVTLAPSDPSASALKATIEEDGTHVTIAVASIEGQTALRCPSELVGALAALVTAASTDSALVIPDPESSSNGEQAGDTE